jgi:2-polyprenyl-3-methyl-5-hydroxy-6-metoxy-1,4-benzoquinol methylase
VKRVDLLLQRLRIRAIEPYLKAGMRVLDIGCADGVLYRLAPPLDSYVGVDPDASEGSIGPNARLVRGMFPTGEIDDRQQFDLLVALAVLEHVPAAEQATFARACARHVAPGGHVAITVPSPIVDPILHVLKSTSIVDGMRSEQHYGFRPDDTPGIFEPHGFQLRLHRRFELGLNHLFVFQSTAGASRSS